MGSKISKRIFIAALCGTPLARPFAALAQQTTMPVVGFLGGRSLADDTQLVAAFRQGLNEIGYVEGRNVAIDFRWAGGHVDRLQTLAADLVAHHVSVIFVGDVEVQIKAIKNAISTTPAVLAIDGDPARLGLASMNRPGSNFAAMFTPTFGLWPKRFDVLRNLMPSVSFIATLIDPNNPSAEGITMEFQTAAKLFEVHMRILKAGGDQEMDDAFATLTQPRAGALFVMAGPFFEERRQKLISLAEHYAIPTIYDRRDFPTDGGLMSYGVSFVDRYRRCGNYVGRILNGAKPAELPILQPSKFELVINLKTAQALGLTVPRSLLATADEVIE